MRRSLVLITAIAALIAFPTMGLAQSDDGLALGPISLYAGYTTGNMNFGVGMDTALNGAVDGLDHAYQLDQIAVGASTSFALDPVLVIVSGWWMMPGSSPESEEYFALPGGTFGPVEWSADTTWWWADALAAYPVGGGFSGIVGFRYENFATSFTSPAFGGLPLFGGFAEAQVESNGYVPLLGVHYGYGTTGTRMSAYVVGFPYLLGDVRYRENLVIAPGPLVELTGNYDGGHFVEAYLDYKTALPGGFDLGVFGRFNTTGGRITGDVDLVAAGGVLVDTQVGDGGLTRNTFTVGAVVDVDFALPNLSIL